VRCLQKLGEQDQKEKKEEVPNAAQAKTGVVRVVSAVLFLATLAGPTGAFAKDKPLYDRLGGKQAISAVVDEFVSRVAADTRINRYFAQAAADPARLASFKGSLWTRSARRPEVHASTPAKT
jgi:hypothetical protein